jgi:ATP-dependent helicase HrpA
MLKALPKTYRRQLVPVNDTAEIIAREMPRAKGDLTTALANFIHRRFSVDIPAAAWQAVAIPDHLRLRFAVVDADGEALAVGREPEVLNTVAPELPPDRQLERARRQWERDDLRDWPEVDLPEQIEIGNDRNGRHTLFPALTVTGAEAHSVGVRLHGTFEQAEKAQRAGVAVLLEQRLAPDLRHLKRQLTLPRDAAARVRFEGGARALEQQLYDRVKQDLFYQPVRTREAFASLAAAAQQALIATGRRYLEAVIPVLEVLEQVRTTLFRVEGQVGAKGPLADFLQARREEIQRLVPARFVFLYGPERLPHLVRYLQAAALRVERAVVQFDRDQAKAEELRRWEDGLQALLDQLDARASDRKRAALEELFWMIEEYKVSLFAQELKTAIPISAKRLEKKVAEIRRMA